MSTKSEYKPEYKGPTVSKESREAYKKYMRNQGKDPGVEGKDYGPRTYYDVKSGKSVGDTEQKKEDLLTENPVDDVASPKKGSYDYAWKNLKDEGQAKYGGDKTKFVTAAKAWNKSKYGTTEPTRDADKAGISKSQLAKNYEGRKDFRFYEHPGTSAPKMDTQTATRLKDFATKATSAQHDLIKDTGKDTKIGTPTRPPTAKESRQQSRTDRRNRRIAKTEEKIKKVKAGTGNKARLGQLKSKLAAQKGKTTPSVDNEISKTSSTKNTTPVDSSYTGPMARATTSVTPSWATGGASLSEAPKKKAGASSVKTTFTGVNRPHAGTGATSGGYAKTGSDVKKFQSDKPLISKSKGNPYE